MGSGFSIIGLVTYALFFAVSCQTLSQQELILPARIQRAFTPCFPTEGALSARISEGGALMKRFEADWVARESAWELHISDQVGIPLVSIRSGARSFRYSGPLAHRLPLTTVGKDGELTFDGTGTAILVAEVPCLLAGRYPEGWLRFLVVQRKIDDNYVLRFRRYGHEFETRFRPEGQGFHSCTRFYKRWLGVFRSQYLEWCPSTEGAPHSELTGWNEYKLKWVSLDSKPS